jgi:glucose-6-phosphate 1-dehydrogenase
MNKINQPFALIIFGASGELARLKLFPAIYNLAVQKRLPRDFHIIGYARSKKTVGDFRKEFEDGILKNTKEKVDKELLKKISSRVSYFQGQYDNMEDFKKLHQYLKTVCPEKNITKLAYFSVPPVVFKDIIRNLGETRTEKNEDIRLVIEKPFGEDQKSATDLFHFVARYFDEDNVYLLDHYLGKSAVQSILHLRHSNRFLNLMMKGPEVSNIQITAFEETGVENRISYFSQVGTIKDMVQSHLFQILALTTMSIPITENTESLHREKYSILSALKFNKSQKNIVLGQYASYQKELCEGCPNGKETFAAVRLFIDRESWYKVPIYIRTGKKLDEKHTYVVIEMKKFGFQPKEEEPNRLIIELYPEEKIDIRLLNKSPLDKKFKALTISDSLASTGDTYLTEHSLLIIDVLNENHINFLSFPEIIATWKITDEIMEFIQKNKIKNDTYKDGSKGPQSQNGLTQIDNFKWFDIH